MSQTAVTSYFNERKRKTSEELRNKSKVQILYDNGKSETLGIFPEDEVAGEVDNVPIRSQMKKDSVARNLQFDLTPKSKPKPRVPRSRKTSSQTDVTQPTIHESFHKLKGKDDKVVLFEKLGSLSPKKTPQKRVTRKNAEKDLQAIPEVSKEPAYMRTPTKSSPVKDMTIENVKSRISGSSRLAELRARIDKFKNSESKLKNLEQLHTKKIRETKKNKEQVKIKEFDRIEIEIPASPIKSPSKFLTPNKFLSPTKSLILSPTASPARRALFEPKESPVKAVTASPTKVPAYQRYQSLIESDIEALPLPYHYRLLEKTFSSIETVTAMMYNRKETVTFSKIQEPVQKLTRKNLTLDLFAQIISIYPEAFKVYQLKMNPYASMQEKKYELVLDPIIEIDTSKSGRNTPDEENIVRSTQQFLMPPNIIVERKRIFHEKLLDIVRDEHEKFLLSLDPPMRIPKEKITRWHPEFDIETCRDIEKAELPEPPVVEKLQSAKELLEKAHSLCNSNSRMHMALEKLSGTNSTIPTTPSKQTTIITDFQKTPEAARNINSSIVDTPPATPVTHHIEYSKSVLKGIPLSLLEKVRAKKAAKALEMMTRSKDEDKEAIMYSRLPEIAKILRNIFVSEKKNVLLLDFVLKKLNDSYRVKLPSKELENHIRLISKILPLWTSVHVKNKMNYIKLSKDSDMAKIIKRLEVLADEKV